MLFKGGTSLSKCLKLIDRFSEDINIPELLHQIIDKNVYKNDYNDITLKLLSKPVSYEKAIKSIETISNSGIFDD